MASDDSRVVVTLDLIGQKEMVAGLGTVADAFKDLQDAAAEANGEISASTDAMSSDVAGAYATIGAAAESTAATIDSSNATADDSIRGLAASYAEASDSIVESNAKMAESTSVTADKTVASSSEASKGLLANLTSMRTLITGGAAYEAIKYYSNYQTQLTQLGTVAGLTRRQIAAVNTEIMRTSASLGQSPSALASAYYNPISEGFGVKGANAVVSAAAKLAGIGNSPLSGPDGASYALSTMMQTLGVAHNAQGANRVAGMLRGGVAAGDMTLPQLLAANSTGYFDVSKAYGINEQSSMGALDFYSSQGVSPQSAATHLRMMLSLLAAPSAQSTKYLTQAGLTTTDVSGLQGQMAALGLTSTKMSGVLQGPNGIDRAVQMLAGASKSFSPGMQEAFDSKVMGGGRSSAAFLEMAAHPELATQMYNRVGQLSTVQGFTTAWKTYTHTTGFQLHELDSQFQTLGIEVGKQLLPAFRGLVTVLGPLLKLGSTGVGSSAIAGGIIGLILKRLGLGRLAGRIGGGGAAGEGAVAGEVGEGAAGAGGTAALGGGLAANPELWAAAPLALAAWGMMPGNYGAAYNRAGLGGGGPSLTPAAINNLNRLGNVSDLAAFANSGYGKKMALGGLLPTYAGGGTVTNRATAVIGEGRSSFPEFVIPTDPQYRSRARGLTGQLLPRLMASGGALGADTQLAGALRQAGQTGLFSAEQLFNPQLVNYVVAQQLSALGRSGLLGGSGGGGTGGGATGGSLGFGGVGGKGGSVSANRSLMQAMAASLGWTGLLWSDLNSVEMAEAGYNQFATNSSTGAYGMAQALPPTKMPFAAQAKGGSSPRAQIGWMLNYISGRYGDPSGAWAHEQAHHWYASGGILPQVKPLLFDGGGILPEGINVVSNQTGAPEGLARVGTGGQMVYNGPQTVQVILDGRVVGEATLKYIRARVARS